MTRHTTTEPAAVANVGQAPDVLRNDGGSRSNALLIRTIGTRSNRDGIGARLKLTVGGKILTRDVKAGSGYLGQNDLRVHFGMGRRAVAERLEILWPSGAIDTVENLDANQILTVQEGMGLISRQRFQRSP